MDWLNKEKIVFLVSLILIAYAIIFIFVTRSGFKDTGNLPAPYSTGDKTPIHWNAEKTLFSGSFRSFWIILRAS